MSKVYVASSWRNDRQTDVVAAVRAAGHEAYDFKQPLGDTGFHWSDIDENWKSWTLSQYMDGLNNQIAQMGFKSDFDAMCWADSCILVSPCGRSAHLEAGYFVGVGKTLIILLAPGEPELMYKMANKLALTIDEAVAALGKQRVRIVSCEDGTKEMRWQVVFFGRGGFIDDFPSREKALDFCKAYKFEVDCG